MSTFCRSGADDESEVCVWRIGDVGLFASFVTSNSMSLDRTEDEVETQNA